MSRVYLVGEAPARSTRVPLGGATGARLAAIMGLAHDELLRRVRARNVLPANPGRAAWGRGGDHFPATAARARALAMLFPPGARVVLLGSRVARAFGHAARPFRWVACGTCTMVIVPHPSGANRWYNCPRNRARAGRFLRRVVAP